MTTPMLKRAVARQFGQPSGLAGRLAGLIMAHRPSNRRRNAWAVEQLDVRPDGRVLEVGSGPGLALRHIARGLTTGSVTGVDHSQTMLAQAKRRNRQAVADGKVRLVQASVESVVAGTTDVNGPFDRILAVNVAMFLRDLDRCIGGLASLLASGGTLAIMFQPRMARATDEAAREAAGRYRDAMRRAALSPVKVKELSAVTPIAVCVLGTKPASGRGSPA